MSAYDLMAKGQNFWRGALTATSITVNRKILGPTPSLLSSCIKPEDLQFAHQLSVNLPNQYETGRQK